MSWWEAVPVLLTVLVVVLIPGGAVLAALGVRGVALLALAAPASAAVLGGGAIILGLVGVGWAAWEVLPLTAVGVLVAVGLRRRFGSPEALRHAPPAGAGWYFGGGLAVAALVGGVPVALGLHRLDRPPQTYDSVFHLNAVRYIEDTGHASSLLLGGLNIQTSGSTFYPAGWHVLAATVVDSIGADPAAVANAMTIVLAAIVLPAGTALATHALLPAWKWGSGVGAICGSVFASLPVLMSTYGTLWPNSWATGSMPAVLGAAALCLRRRRLTSWVAVLLALAGAALLHPSAFFGCGLLFLPMLVQLVARRWLRLRAGGNVRRVLAEAAVPAVLLVAGLVIVTRSAVFASVLKYQRVPVESLAHAFIEPVLDVPLIGFVYGLRHPAYLLAVLIGLGALTALRHPRLRPWVFSLGLAVTAFAISAGVSADSPLRDYVTGFWYNDPVRLAGQVPVVAAPMAAVGVWAVTRMFTRAADWVGPRLGTDAARTVAVRSAGAAVLVILAVVLTGAGYASKRANRVDYEYWPAADEHSRQLVSPAEETLLRDLPQLLPRNAVILADPFSGGSLAYALGDRRVVFPHMAGSFAPAALDALALMPDLQNPQTCVDLDTLGARYLYVDQYVYFVGHAGQGAYSQLDQVPDAGVRLIRRGGSAALYEITACG